LLRRAEALDLKFAEIERNAGKTSRSETPARPGADRSPLPSQHRQ
jgi:hypothetical protein